MPNPTLIHPKTVKLEHYLKIVDTYIAAGCPPSFIPEPVFGEYRPDAYMIDRKKNPVCIEVQLTPISTKKMQTKIEQFVNTYNKEHNATTLLLVSDNRYDKITMPKGFTLQRVNIPKEIYT